jgi:hypothetical protein
MNCNGCIYAEWNRTKNGRLHPGGDGVCRYEYVITELPASMYWTPVSSTPQPKGGFINRKEELKKPCVYYEEGDGNEQ